MKNFSASEFKCPCCDKQQMDWSFTEKLDYARNIAGIPFIITSGYRCPAHNQAVGGVSSSSHIHGHAARHSLYRLGRRIDHHWAPGCWHQPYWCWQIALSTLMTTLTRSLAWYGHMAGKGSRQRPTDTTKYESNWERIFRAPQTAPERNQSQSNANTQGTHKSP